MFTINLDIAHTLSPSQIKNICDKYSITPTLIQENGPAGGNPEYSFSTTKKSNIVNFLKNEYTSTPEIYTPFIY